MMGEEGGRLSRSHKKRQKGGGTQSNLFWWGRLSAQRDRGRVGDAAAAC